MAIAQDDGSPLEGHEIPIRRLSPRDHITIHTDQGVYTGTVTKENGGASPGHETKTVKIHSSKIEGKLKLTHRVSDSRSSPPRLVRRMKTERGGMSEKHLGRVERIVLDGHAPLGGGE